MQAPKRWERRTTRAEALQRDGPFLLVSSRDPHPSAVNTPVDPSVDGQCPSRTPVYSDKIRRPCMRERVTLLQTDKRKNKIRPSHITLESGPVPATPPVRRVRPQSNILGHEQQIWCELMDRRRAGGGLVGVSKHAARFPAAALAPTCASTRGPVLGGATTSVAFLSSDVALIAWRECDLSYLS